jgi:hypothetical protein
MGIRNKILPSYIYFLTLNFFDWIDIFPKPDYKQIIVESLEYCQLADYKSTII